MAKQDSVRTYFFQRQLPRYRKCFVTESAQRASGEHVLGWFFVVVIVVIVVVVVRAQQVQTHQISRLK